MVIVGHQLPNDLYLLSLERLHAVNRPVGMTRGSRVRRHFTDDAVLLQLAIQRVARLRMCRGRLTRKPRIKPDADVIIERIGSRQLAVAGFHIRGLPRRRIPRIFREIKVRNHGVEVALA